METPPSDGKNPSFRISRRASVLLKPVGRRQGFAGAKVRDNHGFWADLPDRRCGRLRWAARRALITNGPGMTGVIQAGVLGVNEPARRVPARAGTSFGGREVGLYNAEISAGSLMIPESRRIATLLLSRPSDGQWEAALNDENLLQKKPATAKRQARLIRNRLETLDEEGLRLVARGDAELCRQILLSAAARHSRLLSDFMRDVYRADLLRLEKNLSHRQWDGFLEECAHRDEAVATWADSTREKLFQVIVRILFEAKYLDSTRQRALTPPLVHPQAEAYLKRLGDAETLARLEAKG